MKSLEQESQNEIKEDISSPQPSTEEEHKPQSDKNWLSDIAKQSWEPELLISGVAIYLTSSLPSFVQGWYTYYVYNHSFDIFALEVLSALLYALADGASYILIATFIIHFAARAFWVGMIGLRSVYPHGINYDNLSTSSEYFKQRVKEKLKSIDQFIEDLDRFCSLLFSSSFTLIMAFMGIFVVYLVFFGFLFLLKALIPKDIFEAYNEYFYYAILIFFLILGGVSAILNSKKYREHPKYGRWQFIVAWNLTSAFIPFLRRPYLFLMLISKSNRSKKQERARGIIFMCIFFVWAFFTPLRPVLHKIFETRTIYTTGSTEHQLKAAYYDNLRDEKQEIIGATIQADIIQEPYIKLFISYPHSLDEKYAAICPDIEVPDSLEKFQKRNLQDAHRLGCIASYYHITINDSLYKDLEFMFYNPPEVKEKGVSTYIPIQNLSPGKHLITLKKAEPDSTDKQDYLYKIPFWYAPD